MDTESKNTFKDGIYEFTRNFDFNKNKNYTLGEMVENLLALDTCNVPAYATTRLLALGARCVVYFHSRQNFVRINNIYQLYYNFKNNPPQYYSIEAVKRFSEDKDNEDIISKFNFHSAFLTDEWKIFRSIEDLYDYIEEERNKMKN